MTRPSQKADDPLAIFRAIAASATAQSLDSGEPGHPDIELLNLCDEIIRLARSRDAVEAVLYAFPPNSPEHARERHRKWCATRRLVRAPLVRAGKLRATTPAGIFAKALVMVRVSDQAPRFTKSLADDLLQSPELRAAIWPVRGEG